MQVLTPPGLYGGGFGAAASAMSSSSENNEKIRNDTYNSPGWQRMKNKAYTKMDKITGNEDYITIEPMKIDKNLVGERVFHQKFGYGSVSEQDGEKLTVSFEKAGEKKVLDTYVVLAEQIII